MVRKALTNKKYTCAHEANIMSYGQKEEKLSDIIKVAKAEVSKLEKLLKKIDAFLCDAPEGCLKWQKKNGKTYYYKQYEKNDKWDRKYIKKDEISQAQLFEV